MTLPKIVSSMSMLLLAGGSLTGCSTLHTAPFPATGPEVHYNIEIPSDAQLYRLRDPFVEAGVSALRERKYQRASDAFNHALKLDTENSYINFLNGLTYHLMAEQGDSSKLALAKVGYLTAAQYDNTAWWNAYFLGLLELEEHNFTQAQSYFAQALIENQGNTEILKGLIAASYYSGDIRMSEWLLDNALQRSTPDADLMRAATIIYSAAGNKNKASTYLEAYKEMQVPAYKVANLESRTRDWNEFRKHITASLAIDNHEHKPSAGTMSPQEPDDIKSPGEPSDKQVVVDVVIIHSTERVVDHQGLNLLNGLSIALGASDTKTLTSVNTGTAQSLSSASQSYAYPRVITRTIAIPSLTYSLNILNTIGDKEEVVAKPSLIALDGEQSQFFSGGELDIGFPATLGGGSLQSKQVGVTLNVTPTFLPGDKIKLAVSATRNAFEDIAPINSFEQSVYTTKNSVTASVIMGFNQTLILSGLTERGTQTIENKVPGLGDIPLIKLLFNDKKKNEVDKSMVFMLTPKRPQVTGARQDPDVDSIENDASLRKLLSQWRAAPYATVPSDADSQEMVRGVRMHDIRYDGWRDRSNITQAVNAALQRLYDR